MHEPSTLSRRTAAALPLAALFGPAAATMPALASPDADAELLDLGRRWEAALGTERAHYATFSDAMSHADAHAHEAVGDELHDVTSGLFELIAATAATTTAGLAVKAKTLAYQNDIENLDEAAIATALVSAHYYEDRAAFSLVLDCLRMARAAA